jgi:hypothetical protein
MNIKNTWSVYRDPIARWEVDLTPALQHPDKLQNWLINVLSAGKTYRVFTIKSAPLLDLQPNSDQSVESKLLQKWNDEHQLDLFHFTAGGVLMTDGYRLGIETEIAYYADEQDLVEAAVDNIGYLRSELNRAIGESESGPKMWPLMINGPLLDLNDPEKSIWNGPANSIRVTLDLYSDIWFPVVRIEDEETGDYNEQNNELSASHTPRLNNFLKEVKSHTTKIGGTMRVDEDWVHPEYEGFVTSEGIIL